MKQKPFNLLKPVQPPKTVWDKIYEWILSRARVVIMFVIILITVAFIAKVVVDTDAKNKNKQVDNGLTELSFFSQSTEPNIRFLIRKIDNYKRLNQNYARYSNILEEVYRVLGNSANEVTVRLQENRLSIFGTDNLTLLRELETKLKNSSTFDRVSFGTIAINTGIDLVERGEYVLTADISRDILFISRF